MLNITPNTDAILICARNAITPREGWTKVATALDKDGWEIGSYDANAVTFSIHGAVRHYAYKLAPTEELGIFEEGIALAHVKARIRKHPVGYEIVERMGNEKYNLLGKFNSDEKVTHMDALWVLNQAIAYLEVPKQANTYLCKNPRCDEYDVVVNEDALLPSAVYNEYDDVEVTWYACNTCKAAVRINC